jgi:OPA family glycerol-3-phosphate transporter-like MFS transporter
MYATYYMCRYNFRFAASGMKEEYGFSTTDIADILASFNIAYGTGQLINGLISDRIGGKTCMLIGATATIAINFFFGFASFPGTVSTLSLIWLMNGYFQAFGAPGMVKINAAWFHRTERGTFAGIFGFMIQAGQMAISKLAPVILAGFTVGAWVVGEGEWRWLFRIPPLFTAAAAIFMAFAAKQSPDDAGYPGVIIDELDNSSGVTVGLKESFQTIFTHPLVWFYAAAYACTGAVRHSSDNLVTLYFAEQLNMDMKANIPDAVTWTLVLMPMAAVLGSFASGWVSDKFFKGHRSPVAMVLYFFEALVIGVAAYVLLRGIVGPTPFGIFLGCVILILVSITANSTHSIVGAAAPMDIGGKKMAGFAAGVIDSFQYYGGSISLAITGRVLDATKDQYGWTFWYAIMAGFGILGGISMYLVMRKQARLQDAPGS